MNITNVEVDKRYIFNFSPIVQDTMNKDIKDYLSQDHIGKVVTKDENYVRVLFNMGMCEYEIKTDKLKIRRLGGKKDYE